MDMRPLRRLAVEFFETAFNEEEFDKLGVEAVAAFVRDEMADEVAASEGQVADEIEGLVADALVLHAHFVIQRSFGTEDEQVLIRHAQAEAAVAKPLGF